MKKLKVLMVSEASFLSSGFGTYAKEILSRLYASGKYEIAELACYGKVNDPQDRDIKWRYYANAVAPNDPRAQQYNSTTENQFGRWRFERVLLDFKPDVVIDVRDYWMNSYQQFSPLRPFFHWVVMPTVDSAPQQEEWIDTYLHADAIFTYSDFGRDTLLEQSNNKINYIDTASPGVSLDIFKPLPNKEELKKTFGLENKFVIGSVMRNQKRKLFPELFVSLKKTLEYYESKNSEVGKNIYLYLHTSYPDAGWDIPLLLKEHGVGNRVLFTYSCKKCNFFRPCLYQHPLTHCPKCGNFSFSMPNVSNGLTQEQLNLVINTFDLYAQYAICEGFGMPQVEAASAGIPIASVDYSAMSDVVKKLNGYPIKVNQYFRELETKAIRVYPSNEELVKIIVDYIEMPDVLKKQKQAETRSLTEKHYNWDNIAKKWEHYLDNIKLTGYQGRWEVKIPKIQPRTQFTNSDNAYEALTAWISENMASHQLASSIVYLNMIRDLDYGFAVHGMQTKGYSIENAQKTIDTIINNHNIAMDAKDNPQQLNPEDYIEYANMKDNTK